MAKLLLESAQIAGQCGHTSNPRRFRVLRAATIASPTFSLTGENETMETNETNETLFFQS